MIKFDLSVRYDTDLSRVYFGDFVAQIQVEALQAHDLQQSQVLSADCMTDWECERLELAQSEAEE